jgi:CBS domain-containing protein
MTIKAILETKGQDVIAVSGDASVGEAVRLLAEKRIGALPVVDGSTVRGIFSERDLIYALARQGPGVLDQPVSAIMTSPAMTVVSDSAIIAALSLMTRRRIRHLPVVDAGILKGFVSIGDLVKHRIEHIESEAAAMRDYIQLA